jgi:hypothetical protein
MLRLVGDIVSFYILKIVKPAGTPDEFLVEIH